MKHIYTLILVSILISIFTYSYLPEKMATHWDSNGEVNGYMSKFWGVALFPILMVFIALLFHYIPKIDPLKKNIKKFQKHYHQFIFVLLIFFLLVQSQVIAWNLNYKIPMNYFMPVLLAILLYYIGVLLEKCEQNWFIGIRTPWTLSDKVVWKKTHERGAVIFKFLAALCIVSLFFDGKGILIVILPVILAVIYLLIYSYFEYKKRH